VSADAPVQVALAEINATLGPLAGKSAQDRRRGRWRCSGRSWAPAPRRPPIACADWPSWLDLFVVVGHLHRPGSAGDLRSKSIALPLWFDAACCRSAGPSHVEASRRSELRERTPFA